MRITVSELAKALSSEFSGDGALAVLGAAEPQDAGPDDLAIAAAAKYLPALVQGRAQVALVPEGTDWRAHGLKAAIFVTRPKVAMAGVARLMDDRFRADPPGVHPTAFIDPTAVIGDDAYIGPFVVIGAGVTVGPDAWIGPHVVVDRGAKIGNSPVIMAGSHIAKDVTIGDFFICHQGVVIGSDGFSYVTPEKSGVETARETLGDQGEVAAQAWDRVHSLGSVVIGNNVEVGANTCIDRGTIRDTAIHDGVKIDNLVHIGHNITIGQDTLVCAQVGMAGSTVIGKNCVFAGQVGISDNKKIGDNVVAGGATKIFANVPSGRVILGNPAQKMDAQIDLQKTLRRLPRILNELKKNSD